MHRECDIVLNLMLIIWDISMKFTSHCAQNPNQAQNQINEIKLTLLNPRLVKGDYYFCYKHVMFGSSCCCCSYCLLQFPLGMINQCCFYVIIKSIYDHVLWCTFFTISDLASFISLRQQKKQKNQIYHDNKQFNPIPACLSFNMLFKSFVVRFIIQYTVNNKEQWN